MAIPVHCSCGAHYNLKYQYAGRLLECPACGARLRAPARSVVPLFDRDVFLLREKHFAVNTKYYVRDEDGNPLLYVERPAMLGPRIMTVVLLFIFAILLQVMTITVLPDFNWFVLAIIAAFFIGPRRHIYFYTDDRKGDVLLTVTQDAVIQFPSTEFTLHDPAGNILATFRKNRFTDFLRKRWWVADPSGALILVAREDSIILSLLRRLTGLIVDLAVFRTNFVLYAPDQERVLGEFNRKMTIFDRYTLDMSEDADCSVDRRVALALGVLLDTGEGR